MAKYEYWPKYDLENYSYTFPLEKTFNAKESTEWMQKYWIHSFTISAVYVIAIHFGRKYMESRKALLLDNALFCWNIGLAIFSLMGTMRMAPEMFWSINSNSFVYSICTASYAQGVTGYWTEKFAMSKVFELIDTAFIVLRKRPLIFLHWYHHITVLVYTWHAFKDHTASGRWFIFMNYAVHTLMYTYYALRSIRLRIPKLVAMVVTFLQIAQMIVGVGIGVYIYFIKRSGDACQQTWTNLYFSFTIYFTYLLLFCNFFYKTYLKRGGGVSLDNRKKANSKEAVKAHFHLKNGSIHSREDAKAYIVNADDNNEKQIVDVDEHTLSGITDGEFPTIRKRNGRHYSLCSRS